MIKIIKKCLLITLFVFISTSLSYGFDFTVGTGKEDIDAMMAGDVVETNVVEDDLDAMTV